MGPGALGNVYNRAHGASGGLVTAGGRRPSTFLFAAQSPRQYPANQGAAAHALPWSVRLYAAYRRAAQGLSLAKSTPAHAGYLAHRRNPGSSAVTKTVVTVAAGLSVTRAGAVTDGSRGTGSQAASEATLQVAAISLLGRRSGPWPMGTRHARMPSSKHFCCLGVYRIYGYLRISGDHAGPCRSGGGEELDPVTRVNAVVRSGIQAGFRECFGGFRYWVCALVALSGGEGEERGYDQRQHWRGYFHDGAMVQRSNGTFARLRSGFYSSWLHRHTRNPQTSVAAGFLLGR